MTRIAAVVPSLGASPVADEALAALRRELAAYPGPSELVWVQQGGLSAPPLEGADERLVALPAPAGFAAAVDRGYETANPESELLLVMNDDLVLEPGWLATLVALLGQTPGAGAVQGQNLRLADPARTDGCGLAWNRDWQAVQLRDGEAPLPGDAAPFEIFGVSATAALYRTSALAAAAGAGGSPFDRRLGSYYEDVELAVRLRQAGFASYCLPAARALHAGQATSRRAPRDRWRLVYRNRRWVVASLLGARLASERARIERRDRRDLLRRLAGLDFAAVAGILDGLREARRAAPPFAGDRQRALAAAERLTVGSAA
ncbi:MAG: glycosyltransferase family 2 protein [Thermoanaerobaculia bacterium]